MREVTAHPRSVPAADIPVEPDEEPRHNAPQSYDGAPPPVADFATPRPTASERAYDDGDFVSRLPQELVALIAELSPESIVELLHAHADMSAAILTTVERVRGATFAQQVSSIHPMHKPTPTEQPVAARHAPPPAPTPPADAERAKRAARSMTAAWDQLAIATPDERATPESVRLPPNIVKQLEQAWQDSLAGKQEREQGGSSTHS